MTERPETLRERVGFSLCTALDRIPAVYQGDTGLQIGRGYWGCRYQIGGKISGWNK